jgi:hypothetical protein
VIAGAAVLRAPTSLAARLAEQRGVLSRCHA